MALIRVALVTHDAAALALFYQTALGFSQSGNRLRHGNSAVELLTFDPPGRAYPSGQAANSLAFQHFAIVTPDIAAAYTSLRGAAGWQPISAAGPVQLPASSGGAIAFKFRDPEGHPLELIQLTTDNTPRIDHTAIVVRDTAVSIDFYRTHGLTPQGGTHNQGPAQAALDGLQAADVQVTRLGDARGQLHLELLCYRGQPALPPPVSPHDVAATRLVFDAGTPGLATDPDGHHLLIE